MGVAVGHAITDGPFKGLTPPYDVIVADPPWAHKSNSEAKPGRNPRRHYPTMSVEEIASMPVRPLGAENSALILWIPPQFLVIGAHLTIMRFWGYKPSSVFGTWVKTNGEPSIFGIRPEDVHMGTGHTTRKGCEFVLIGKRGRSLRKRRDILDVMFAGLREHSRKPAVSRQVIRDYFGPDARILELFSREPWDGVDVWGNETGKFPSGVAP